MRHHKISTVIITTKPNCIINSVWDISLEERTKHTRNKSFWRVKPLTMSQSSYHSLLLVSVHQSIIQSYTRVGSQKFLLKAKTFGNCQNIFLYDGCSSYKLLRVVPIQLNNWPTREQARSDRDSATRLSPMSDSSLLRLNDSSCDMVCGILLRCNFIYVPNTNSPLVATIMMEWINNSVKLTTIHEVEHSRDNFWPSTSHKTLNFTSSLATIHHCQLSMWKYMITVSAQ